MKTLQALKRGGSGIESAVRTLVRVFMGQDLRATTSRGGHLLPVGASWNWAAHPGLVQANWLNFFLICCRVSLLFACPFHSGALEALSKFNLKKWPWVTGKWKNTVERWNGRLFPFKFLSRYIEEPPAEKPIYARTFFQFTRLWNRSETPSNFPIFPLLGHQAALYRNPAENSRH